MYTCHLRFQCEDAIRELRLHQLELHDDVHMSRVWTYLDRSQLLGGLEDFRGQREDGGQIAHGASKVILAEVL